MTLHIFPRKMWSRTSSVLVMAMVVIPALALGLSRSPERTLRHIAGFDDLIIAPAILIAAVGFYAGWRLTNSRSLSWVAFAVAGLGCEALALMAAELLRGGTASTWTQLADGTALTTVALCVYLSRRRVLPVDPIAAGAGLGLVLAGIRLSALALPDLLPHIWLWRAVATVVLDVVVCALLLSMPGRRPWQMIQLSLTTVLLSVAHLIAYVTAGRASEVVVIVADLVAAAVLLCAALVTLRSATEQARTERDALQQRLAAAEVDARVERARMHELNSTIAGITSASRLIRNRRITEQRRHLLESMMQSELARLERLVSSGQGFTIPAPGRTAPNGLAELEDLGEVDLDSVLTTLALSQQARGREVRWNRSGRWARGDTDSVTEILQILLDNGALHGGSPVQVSLTQVGYAIEICVNDSGPGVAPEMRDRLFDWGVRGSDSRGQGIGLHIARKLAEQQAGYLTLRDVPDRQGATFVLWLPAAERSGELHDIADHDSARRFA
ncbi:sensor histidine kinase [Nocardioides sp.]|uniref:sensor histidine kinase n=1 Tax=Nocardioides sp. TaxID=35761 RepID=UPI0039E3B1D3